MPTTSPLRTPRAAALAAVGLLALPFGPDPGTCTAMFADPDGDWRQRQDDPDGTDRDG
ncbi:hypothetical protein AB0J25_28690 [Streptomyces sp. NPDC049910]|uniref:hypothetical protein n=1 Tax=Streptomyces sp. NPDC049910 TaxID=3155278 RepID=UPI003442BEC8